MNKTAAISLVLVVTSLSVQATDPVGDYISRFSPVGGDRTFYSSDALLRLDLDLNGDGQKEVLLSMARDRNGKQGNVWSVYSQAIADGSAPVGTVTFNSSRFYLGPIDEINQFGLVTFWPSGAGEGTLAGYLLDGAAIREVQVASITRDAEGGELQGQDILDKYMNRALVGDDVTTSIHADTLAKQYGVKIDGKTYREVAEDSSQSQQRQLSETSSTSPDNRTATDAQALTTSPTASESPRVDSAVPGGVTESHKTRWFIILILIIAAVAIMAVYRRSRG